MKYRRVAEARDIPLGQGTVVQVDGKQIALFNVAGVFYAVENTCTHRGGPLGEGTLRGTTITCPWHGAQFDVTSGQVLGAPASRNVTSYTTRLEGGSVWVAID